MDKINDMNSLDYLNCINANTKFTMEVERHIHLLFKDALITRKGDVTVGCSFYN